MLEDCELLDCEEVIQWISSINREKNNIGIDVQTQLSLIEEMMIVIGKELQLEYLSAIISMNNISGLLIDLTKYISRNQIHKLRNQLIEFLKELHNNTDLVTREHLNISKCSTNVHNNIKEWESLYPSKYHNIMYYICGERKIYKQYKFITKFCDYCCELGRIHMYLQLINDTKCIIPDVLNSILNVINVNKNKIDSIRNKVKLELEIIYT